MCVAFGSSSILRKIFLSSRNLDFAGGESEEMISLIVAAMVMVVAASVLMGVSVRVQANAQKT